MRGVRGVYPVVMATLVLIALSVGCLGGPEGVADRDVVVLKLAADGAPKWMRTIDTGEDDGADDLIELSDGGFAIAAQNGSDPRGPARPRIVRLAPDGTVLWDRFVTDGTEIARAIVPTGDGGMAVLTGNGTVVRFDGKGRTDWARATGMTEAQALLALADGGFIAGGDVTYHATTNITVPPVPGRSVDPATARLFIGREGAAARLSAGGETIWERRYGESGLTSVGSLAESPDRTGLLIAGSGERPNESTSENTPLLILRIDPSGAPVSVGTLDATPPYGPLRTRAESAGYRVFYATQGTGVDPSHGVTEAVLDPEGRVRERRPLAASMAVARTPDGGYFSVGTPVGDSGPGLGTESSDRPSASNFYARRLDATGAIVWDHELPTGLISRVKMVVPTSDGGFAVLAVKDIE